MEEWKKRKEWKKEVVGFFYEPPNHPFPFLPITQRVKRFLKHATDLG